MAHELSLVRMLASNFPIRKSRFGANSRRASRWKPAQPQLGRFLSPDPIGFAGGLNQYGYVGGNPTNGVDPSGLQVGPAGAFVGVVVGGTVCTIGICKANTAMARYRGVPNSEVQIALQAMNPAYRGQLQEILDFYISKYPDLTDARCGRAAEGAYRALDSKFGKDKRFKNVTFILHNYEPGFPPRNTVEVRFFDSQNGRIPQSVFLYTASDSIYHDTVVSPESPYNPPTPTPRQSIPEKLTEIVTDYMLGGGR